MQVNYEFVLDICRELSASGKILDYGCGGGEVVMEGRGRNLDIVGVEAFFGGSKARDIAESNGLLNVSVFPLGENFKIQFSDEAFDLVVSNQVMEHVEDLALTFGEINRVLRPNGIFLALFPDRDVIREGHCGIPFAHWFHKKSNWRYPYMLSLRQLGLGYHKGDKSPRQWTLDFMSWLDNYTFYRSATEIVSAFESNGFSIREIEYEYINYRLAKKGFNLPSRVRNNLFWRHFAKYACRKLGGMVVIATKQKASV